MTEKEQIQEWKDTARKAIQSGDIELVRLGKMLAEVLKGIEDQDSKVEEPRGVQDH